MFQKFIRGLLIDTAFRLKYDHMTFIQTDACV